MARTDSRKAQQRRRLIKKRWESRRRLAEGQGGAGNPASAPASPAPSGPASGT